MSRVMLDCRPLTREVSSLRHLNCFAQRAETEVPLKIGATIKVVNFWVAGGAGGPGLTHKQIRVPHLRDGLIVAKMGIRAETRTVVQ
jgi:hypothetical protein